jgi:hypothetical protein
LWTVKTFARHLHEAWRTSPPPPPPPTKKYYVENVAVANEVSDTTFFCQPSDKIFRSYIIYLQHLFCHFIDGKIRDLLKAYHVYRIFTSLQLVTFLATHYANEPPPPSNHFSTYYVEVLYCT